MTSGDFHLINSGLPDMDSAPADLAVINNAIQRLQNTGEVSNGSNTFEELYAIQMAYNVALFNTWANLGIYDVYKSKRHHDGKLCFGGGYFIVAALLPEGQISNHYELTDENWDAFKIPEVKSAKFKFDGHTTETVVERLLNLE